MLMPEGESRPRWWVRSFVNPFYHKVDKKVVIKSSVRKDLLPFNRFVIGRGSVVEDFSVLNNGMGDVIIGEKSFIGLSNVIIGPVRIGNNVILAQNVVISGLNHNYENINIPIKDQHCTGKNISIDNDCWIGANAVITAGVCIGKHVVVAAGSVVTKSVPEYSVVAGIPARIIKQYDFKKQKWEKVQK